MMGSGISEPLDNIALPASSLPNIILSNLENSSIDSILPDILRTIRSHLNMDVAFISEFVEDRRIFRYVDAAPDRQLIHVGNSDPLSESYCEKIVAGTLPQLIQDATQVPAALEIPATLELPVGAHISIPLRLSNGKIYGTFCCFSLTPDSTLVQRDLDIMSMFAEFVGKQIERQIIITQAQSEMEARINSVLSLDGITCFYQPIYHIASDRIIGFEALTRFAAEPIRPPDIWFQEATKVGLGKQLEIKAINKALQGLSHFPEDTYLSLNVSPETILSGAIATALEEVPLDRIVLEVTEHVSIPDYAEFCHSLEPLRARGLRLAVDDAGAGYASFRHILRLNPDLIKLDMSLTRDIDSDRSRRALAAALIRFAQETGSRIIAEGVETPAELATLRQLCINNIQGYLIARPLPLTAAVTFLQQWYSQNPVGEQNVAQAGRLPQARLRQA
ncbi:EAL domain-containing protein [Leptolyngbya sp. PCC 6406]|uniref:EAL domain-containing protein n=1 Tax=Leptolyngbya sp. PCC 6406 TaxID=1173264 RepID=UPI0002AD0065|nr:EAL domain-containing protein [Leptolyngbya sp. PCC 6406]